MQPQWRQWLASAALCFAIFDVASGHSVERGPLDRVAVLEAPALHTAGRRVHAHSNFDLSFRVPDVQQRVKFVLEPNHDILPPGAEIKFVDANGQIQSELIDRKQHRVFKGTSWLETKKDDWMQVGWARVSVHRDGAEPVFEGAFTIGNDHHHIQLGSFYKSTKHAQDPHLVFDEHNDMIVWRDSDISRMDVHSELKRDATLEPSCRADALGFNSNPQHPLFTAEKRSTGRWGSMSFGSLLGKRQIDGGGAPGGGNSAGVNLKSTIGSTVGCPTTRKVALMGVATDCEFLQSFNGDNQTMRLNVISNINSASHVYETSFNVSLGLQTLFTQPADCPATPPASAQWNRACTSNASISDRLNDFSAWRGQQKDTNALWTLLTNCPTQSEVGLAWLGQLCVSTAQNSSGETATGANIVAKTNTEWNVIAHEIGHTFGAVHDCDSQTCADGHTVAAQQCCPRSNSTCDAGGQFIMNPSTGDGITSFSPCTIGNICSALGRNSVKSNCLSDNTGVTTITGHECGNGIVEEGEECDCGGTEGCGNDKCCDPTTCKFTTGSVCDDSNEECCRSCQLATSGTVCRPSTGVCNPQEVCSGTNSSCPPDQTAPNGQSCGNGLQCAAGQCTSRDLQCKQLMGSYTSNNDTYACDNSDCMLSCASPEFGANTCYSMQQNFLDGTPCGATGSCSNGQCQGDSLGGEITSWVGQNKPLVIGLCCGIGGLLLLAILSCIVSRVRRARRPPLKPNATSGAMGGAPPGWNGRRGVNGSPPSGWYGRGSGGARGSTAGAAVPQQEQPWNQRRGWSSQPPMQQQTWDGPMPPPAAQWGANGGYRGASVRYA